MTITECENIIIPYFKNNFMDYEHSHGKKLIVNGSNYRIRPDDRFRNNHQMIIVEYENTKRQVESISKYWWLRKNTSWIDESIVIKLL